MLKRVGRALLREGARTAVLLLLVTAAMFLLLDLAPGDPMALYVNVQSLSPQELAAVRHELGLDRSLPVRYGVWLRRTLTGDLGTSLRSGRPVSLELWRTGWRTLLLAGHRHGADAPVRRPERVPRGDAHAPRPRLDPDQPGLRPLRACPSSGWATWPSTSPPRASGCCR